MKRRSTYIKKTKLVKVDEEMMRALAKDLVEMHNDKVFNLHYWPAAREVVGHFYKKEQ
jgi:hypothetical protein